MIEMLIILCRSHVEENHKKLQQRNPILLSDLLNFHDYVTKDVNGAQKDHEKHSRKQHLELTRAGTI